MTTTITIMAHTMSTPKTNNTATRVRPATGLPRLEATIETTPISKVEARAPGTNENVSIILGSEEHYVQANKN